MYSFFLLYDYPFSYILRHNHIYGTKVHKAFSCKLYHLIFININKGIIKGESGIIIVVVNNIGFPFHGSYMLIFCQGF